MINHLLCSGKACSHSLHPISHYLLLPPLLILPALSALLSSLCRSARPAAACVLLPSLPSLPHPLLPAGRQPCSLTPTASSKALTLSSAFRPETHPGSCNSPGQGALAMPCLHCWHHSDVAVRRGAASWLIAPLRTGGGFPRGHIWGQEGSLRSWAPVPVLQRTLPSLLSPKVAVPGCIHHQLSASNRLCLPLIALTEKLELLWCH